jgi:hypothetical protein
VVPFAVSLSLVIVGTVYPVSAVIALTVPIGALVAIYLARDRWRAVCVRLAVAILLLAVGGIAAEPITGRYGAVGAALPCVLAALLFASCEVMPAEENALLAAASMVATVCAGAAALFALIASLDSLFYPLYATQRADDALTFALLSVGAPGLILLMSRAVPWTGDAAFRADAAAVVAMLTGLASAFILGRIPDPLPFALITQVVANGAAVVLIVHATILGARAATTVA